MQAAGFSEKRPRPLCGSSGSFLLPPDGCDGRGHFHRPRQDHRRDALTPPPRRCAPRTRKRRRGRGTGRWTAGAGGCALDQPPPGARRWTSTWTCSMLRRSTATWPCDAWPCATRSRDRPARVFVDRSRARDRRTARTCRRSRRAPRIARAARRCSTGGTTTATSAARRGDGTALPLRGDERIAFAAVEE